MRRIGTQASGIRLPIINHGDDLAGIVAESLFKALGANNMSLKQPPVF
jgi:hypothetical protein